MEGDNEKGEIHQGKRAVEERTDPPILGKKRLLSTFIYLFIYSEFVGSDCVCRLLLTAFGCYATIQTYCRGFCL